MHTAHQPALPISSWVHPSMASEGRIDRNNVEIASLLQNLKKDIKNSDNHQEKHNKNHQAFYDLKENSSHEKRNGENTFIWLERQKIVHLFHYLSSSCEGLSWLHGSSSSLQSLLTHQAVKKTHGNNERSFLTKS